MSRGAAGVLALAMLAAGVGCAEPPPLRFAAAPTTRKIHRPALYPESIAWDAPRDRFVVGSFREGALYAVDRAGAATKLVDDPRLCSVLGVAIDASRGRLWAVSADLGASLKASSEGPKGVAAVGVYDLASGRPIRWIDLAPLAPGPHLANGIALDREGRAYVTDSFANVVYRADAEGRASVFARDPRFAGDGINLNGLVVHPDGFLLVVKKSDGALFKVPLAHPGDVRTVAVRQRFVGGDGLVLRGDRELVVVANQVPGTPTNAVFDLVTHDEWASAEVSDVRALGDVYPTGGVLRDDTLYVLHTRLNQLIAGTPEDRSKLRVEATLLELGNGNP